MVRQRIKEAAGEITKDSENEILRKRDRKVERKRKIERERERERDPEKKR